MRIRLPSCGLAVITATAPGGEDIFEGGAASGGLLVPVDAGAAFAAALGRLLDDADACRELGRRAQRRAEECFSLDAIGPRLADLLTPRCG